MTYYPCDGPGMHRLHDEHDMVAPCPNCKRHHFGPRGQIEDSTVSVFWSGEPTLRQLLGRIPCSFKGHQWGGLDDYQMAHLRRCRRCDATQMFVPVIVVGEVGDPFSLLGRDDVPPEYRDRFTNGE